MRRGFGSQAGDTIGLMLTGRRRFRPGFLYSRLCVDAA